MIPKSDTIDAIVRFNPGAEPSFLAGFSNDELARYLERLTDSARYRAGENGPNSSDSGGSPSAAAPAARRAG